MLNKTEIDVLDRMIDELEEQVRQMEEEEARKVQEPMDEVTKLTLQTQIDILHRMCRTEYAKTNSYKNTAFIFLPVIADIFGWTDMDFTREEE